MSGIVDAYAERKAARVYEETWGHLDPAPGSYRGWVLYMRGVYESGTAYIIDAEFAGLDASPQMYDDLNSLVDSSEVEEGAVYLFEGTYRAHKNGGHRFSGTTTRQIIRRRNGCVLDSSPSERGLEEQRDA